jgi:thiamine pyrophosphate-dependent acetolactate synthase large subunit-like protein
MNVSDVLLEVLFAHGVKHIFGIPGDAINDVTDALRRQRTEIGQAYLKQANLKQPNKTA